VKQDRVVVITGADGGIGSVLVDRSPAIRVAENHTGRAWPAMRRQLQRIATGTFTVDRAILPRTRVSAARKFSYRSWSGGRGDATCGRSRPVARLTSGIRPAGRRSSGPRQR
jgi:hypothetical protein